MPEIALGARLFCLVVSMFVKICWCCLNKRYIKNSTEHFTNMTKKKKKTQTKTKKNKQTKQAVHFNKSQVSHSS